MNISSPRMLASPSSASGRADTSLVSPTPTDIQDTNSSHSDQLTNNSSSSALAHSSNQFNNKQAATKSHDSNQASSPKMNLKTEYKSNFTPFDQYVYNELTDSFVKQQTAAPCNNLLIESNCRISASSSNQNLASSALSDLHATSSASPALEVSAFEPNNGADHHHDVTNEPWYREVVKRNEKANEYRFKSEVGHNSPLLKDGSTNDEPMTRRSPLCIETLMDSQSANGDSSASQGFEELSSKRSYKFTPHDYKRDHLIATMANNNNFNLPKKHSTPETSKVTPAKRVTANSAATSGPARPLSRTTAQVRARSQSSRRQNVTAPQVVKKEPATKSNQTTPVKTVPARATTATRVPASHTATKTTKAPVGNSTFAKTTTRPVNSVSNGASSMTQPNSTVSRRTPTSASTSRTATNSATSRLSKNTSVTPRSQAASSLTSKTSPRVPNRGPITPTTKTTPVSQQVTKSPVKRVVGTTTGVRTTTRPIASTSNRNSMSVNKAPATKSSSPSTATSNTNAIKSIKTKALTDAGGKAAAGAVAAASDPIQSLISDSNKDAASQDSKEQVHAQKDLGESNVTALGSRFDQQIDHTNTDYVMNQEPNLIFTTTESGNMLADEIAQAEREAKRRELQELPSEQGNTTADLDSPVATSKEPVVKAVSSGSIDLGSHEREDTYADDSQARHSESKVDSQPGDLVNGLTGQIVSAEDRYDSSEHDASVEFEAQQTGQLIGQQNNDDEPYSIMPTTFDAPPSSTQISAQQNLGEGPEKYDPDSSDSLHNKILGGHNFQSTIEHVDDFEVSRQIVPDDSTLSHADPSGDTPDISKNANSNSTEKELAQSEVDIKNGITGEEQAPIEGRGLETLINDQRELATAISHQISINDSELNGNLNDQEHDGEKFRRGSSHDVQLEEHDEMLTSKSESELNENIEPKLTQHSRADSTFSSDFGSQDSELPRKTSLLEEATDSGKNDQEEDYFIEQDEKSDRHVDPEVRNQHGQSEDAANENSVYVPESTESIAMEEPPKIDMKHELSTNEEDYDLQSHEEDKQRQQQQQQETVKQTLIDGNINDEHVSESIDSGDESIDERTDHNELLMNVAGLVDAESRKKEEMFRKSELAKHQSNSQSSLNFSQPTEILLSPDQLNERFAQSNDGDGISDMGKAPHQHGDDNNKDLNTTHENEVSQHAVSFGDDISGVIGKSEKQQETRFESDDLTISDVKTNNPSDIQNAAENASQNPVKPVSTEDLVNFGSLTSGEDKVDQAAGEVRLDANSQPNNLNDLMGLQEASQQDNAISSSQQVGTRLSEHEDSKINMEQRPFQSNKSRESIDEKDSDDEEQLKLSNHLTNSDDDVILEPRNTKSVIDDDYSPHKIVAGSRYNEGAGLGLMAQEQQLDGLDTAELADGSSAEIVEPSVVEKRIELSTSKSMMPDILPSSTFIHGPKFSQGSNIDYDDDDQDLSLDPNADPIDVAATMSPSSSVAEEMMRLSRNASNASTTHITSKLIDELSISKSYSDEFSRANLANEAETREQSSNADPLNNEQVVELEKHAVVSKHEDTLTMSGDINKGLDHNEISEAFERKSTDQAENSPQTISGTTDVLSGFSAGTFNITNNNNNDLNGTLNDSNNTK